MPQDVITRINSLSGNEGLEFTDRFTEETESDSNSENSELQSDLEEGGEIVQEFQGDETEDNIEPTGVAELDEWKLKKNRNTKTNQNRNPKLKKNRNPKKIPKRIIPHGQKTDMQSS